MRSKVLITGGSGFIGRNLKEFLESRYDIYVPSHRELDLLNTDSVEKYLRDNRFNVIIHTANTNNTKYTDTSDYALLNRNLIMYYNLTRCNTLYGKMLYYGSGAEFDANNYVYGMTEDYFGKHIPSDAYGLSKYTMNVVAEHLENVYNLRLFGVYGKYEEWHRRFISNNICRALLGYNLSINQDMLFDYIDVEDLCKLTVWFIENIPVYHTYNVCSGKGILLSEIAKIISDVYLENEFEIRSIRILKDGRKNPYTGNNERLLSEVGQWQFKSLQEGIKDLLIYYKELYCYNEIFHQELIKKIHDV